MRKLKRGSRIRTFAEDIRTALGLIGRAFVAFLMFQFSEAAFLMVLAYVYMRYEHEVVEQVEEGPDWPEGM